MGGYESLAEHPSAKFQNGNFGVLRSKKREYMNMLINAGGLFSVSASLNQETVMPTGMFLGAGMCVSFWDMQMSISWLIIPNAACCILWMLDQLIGAGH